MIEDKFRAYDKTVIEDLTIKAYMDNKFNLVCSTEYKAVYLVIEEEPKEFIDVTDNIIKLLVMCGIEDIETTFVDIHGNETTFDMTIKSRHILNGF